MRISSSKKIVPSTYLPVLGINRQSLAPKSDCNSTTSILMPWWIRSITLKFPSNEIFRGWAGTLFKIFPSKKTFSTN